MLNPFRGLWDKILDKGVQLPCDEESCMCGTKDCIFWKSLDNNILRMST